MPLPRWLRKPPDETRYSETEMIDLAFGFLTRSGAFNVTQETALTSNAVLACLIVRAETFASLPVHVYRQTDGARERADDPMQVLVGGYANPVLTSREFWRWKQLTEDIRGNAYVWVERAGGRPSALWPMTSSDMKLRYDPSTRIAVYDYAGDSFVPKGTYSARDVLHFRGPLNQNGYVGTSLVEKARTVIGLTIGSEQFYERLLSNGNHFPGHLETDMVLRDEDVKALRQRLKEYSGIEHAGETRLFDRGIKFVQNKMTVQEADLTAQQTWYLQEVCRIFRVPPMLVQDWSRSTYTNSEQADIWFAKHTILPIAANTEAVVNRIFFNSGRPDVYVKFELEGLLRGDYTTRSEGYQKLIQAGVLSPNEVRAYEDLNPYEGGDDFLRPMNFVAVDPETGAIKQSIETDEPDSDPDDSPDEARSLREGKVLAQRNWDKVTGARDLLDEVLADAEGRGIAPVMSDALDRIRSRAASDAERGKPHLTVEYARKVLAPFAEVMGFPLDALAEGVSHG